MKERELKVGDVLDLVEVVRCKDCKFRRDMPVLGRIMCMDNTVHDADWFCADGERKDGDGE